MICVQGPKGSSSRPKKWGIIGSPRALSGSSDWKGEKGLPNGKPIGLPK